MDINPCIKKILGLETRKFQTWDVNVTLVSFSSEVSLLFLGPGISVSFDVFFVEMVVTSIHLSFVW